MYSCRDEHVNLFIVARLDCNLPSLHSHFNLNSSWKLKTPFLYCALLVWVCVCVSVFAFVCAWCGVVCVDFVHQQTKMARKLWTANVRASMATPVGVALLSPVANTVAAALRAGNAFRNGRTSIFNGHMYRGGHVKRKKWFYLFISPKNTQTNY